MDTKDGIYIYYNEKNSEQNVKLEDYIQLLEKYNDNKSEIIRIFNLKFQNDFFEAIEKLNIDEPTFTYSNGILLMCAIDVLAKHSSKVKSGNKNTYIAFLNAYFKFEDIKYSNYFYDAYRCGLIHSNSTSSDEKLNFIFTISTLKGDQIIFTHEVVENTICLQLKLLFDKTKKVFEEFIDDLSDSKNYENFITVQKKLYTPK